MKKATTMKSTNVAIVLALSILCAGFAQAAVSEQEAKQIGTTLTPFGAEMAGNKEGTIPRYTGGLTTPPAGYKPGSGWRPDPFPQDKPLFSIDAKNMDKYADKLTEGAKTLLKTYPTYRIDVYETRRTAAYPKHVLDNTVKNATRCKTQAEGEVLDRACKGGIPFPIPKNGYESMWNHLVNFALLAKEGQYQIWFVNAAGRPVLTSDLLASVEYPYYDPQDQRSDVYFMSLTNTVAPARSNGQSAMIMDHLNPVETGRRAWSYFPGQRRVRLAPDFTYDTPSDGTGGALHFDMINIFTGRMDRFDFKLAGKKEIYMPYNNYKLVFDTKPEDALGPNHIKPELMRWELHRVWVVEATLKPGKRHVFKKWTFYWDEDSSAFGMSDAWDGNGNLYKTMMSANVQLADAPSPNADTNVVHDFNNRIYSLIAGLTPNGPGIKVVQRKPSSFYTPEAMAGSGVR
jgi:hypothetical protein